MMFMRTVEFNIPTILAVMLFLLAGISTALADQVTLSYKDANGNAQLLSVDAESSSEVLALAASLIGEDGIGVLHDADNGTGSLAEIAAAMATAAPMYAADVARVLAIHSRDNSEAIVAAVNAVPGVNNNSVAAAVKFGLQNRASLPQALEAEHASRRRFDENPAPPPVSGN